MEAKRRFDAGERNAEMLREAMLSVIQPLESAKVDYVSVADQETLEELEAVERPALLSLAVFVENVRLIDNIIVGI
jgi:pantoate--beta-alanine ligase